SPRPLAPPGRTVAWRSRRGSTEEAGTSARPNGPAWCRAPCRRHPCRRHPASRESRTGKPWCRSVNQLKPVTSLRGVLLSTGLAESLNLKSPDMTGRIVCLTMALVSALWSPTVAADRQWQTGTWRDSGDARTYVIATQTIRLHLEDGPGSERRMLEAAAGTPVKFVIEGDRAFVLDRQGAEHELHVLRTVNLNYTATGAGHYIKAMSGEGLRVTLEDNSVWELDPRSQFFTI